MFAVGELTLENHVNKEEFSRFVDEFHNLMAWFRLGEDIIQIPDADIPAGPVLKMRRNSGDELSISQPEVDKINSQRRNSQLSDVEFSFLFRVFEEEAQDGYLNQEQFRNCLHKVLPSLQPSEEYDEDFKDFQFANLFSMFDLNGDGAVSLSEFSAAMSLLCKGTKTEKLLLGFNLFDTNRDGYVSFDELKSYLVSHVLTLMSGLSNEETSDDTRDELNRMAEQMALDTTTEFFQRAGIPLNDRISRKDFLQIYETNNDWIPWLGLLQDFFDPTEEDTEQPSEANETVSQHTEGDNEDEGENTVDENDDTISNESQLLADHSQSEAEEEDLDDTGSISVPLNQTGDHTLTINPADLSSFRFLREHLSGIPIANILDSFSASVQSEKGLSRGDFVQCITSLLPEHRLTLEQSKTLFSFSLSNLFDMLDRDGNGYVDTTELLVGVHCISHGSRRDKLALVFHCFDRDGDGEISYEEMFRCFSTFLITVSSLSSIAKEHDPDEMYGMLTEAAEEATKAVFDGAEVGLDQRISFESFIDIHDNKSHLIPWLQLLEINDPVADIAPQEGERKVRERRLSMSEPDPCIFSLDLPNKAGLFELRQSDLQDFELLRKAFYGIQVVDMLQVFDNYTDSEGKLNTQGFALCFRDLFPEPYHDENQMELVHSLLNFFFNTFDNEATGAVDMMEFLIGNVVLLPMTPLQKVSIAFMAMDRDRDAMLSHEELLTLMISFLKVMLGLNFSAREDRNDEVSTLIPQVAAAYVQQLFNLANNNNNKTMSFPEFQEVLTNSENLPWFTMLTLISGEVDEIAADLASSDQELNQIEDFNFNTTQDDDDEEEEGLKSDPGTGENDSFIIDDASSIAALSATGSEKMETFAEMNTSASSTGSVGWPASWIPPQIALSEEHTLQLRAESVLRLQTFKTSFVALETAVILEVCEEHAHASEYGNGMLTAEAFGQVVATYFLKRLMMIFLILKLNNFLPF